MTLKSALQDLRETTLAAISGLLAKLAYLGSLRRREGGGYQHWGMTLLHGEESSERALKTAHAEVLSTVLRTPISELEEDLHESSRAEEGMAGAYVEGMQEKLSELIPSRDPVSTEHLSSVLLALSSLEKNRKPATPSAS
jgi:hypothetical protein